jgi:tetratricopeptide (TPR) repeat protein
VLAWSGLLIVLAGGPVAEAAAPGYDAARRFAYELQTDHAQRGLPALLERLDSEAMRRRTMAPLGRAVLTDGHYREAWEKFFWPGVTHELQPLQSMRTLLAEQPALIDGERVIGIILLDDEGNLHALSLWLVEHAGRIVVADFRGLAQSLPISRRFRQMMLLWGAPFTSALDDEERALSFAPLDNRHRMNLVFEAVAKGRINQAHEHWSRMTDEVRGTRLWSDFRDIWAGAGLASAWHQWLKEHEAGRGTSPLLALAHERRRADKTRALAAVDQLIARAMNSPFLRTVKAELLLEAGRAPEALELAREVYQRNPFAVHACPVALGAALEADRPAEALAALEHWGRLVPADQIESFLQRDARTHAFRNTEGYLAWRRAQPPAAVTAPSSE